MPDQSDCPPPPGTGGLVRRAPREESSQALWQEIGTQCPHPSELKLPCGCKAEKQGRWSPVQSVCPLPPRVWISRTWHLGLPSCGFSRLSPQRHAWEGLLSKLDPGKTLVVSIWKLSIKEEQDATVRSWTSLTHGASGQWP